jgi:ABC-2 type transport system ATP-binding protein
MTDQFAIAVSGLTKRYGDTVALDDFSIMVPKGSIFGVLGTNGAGKTTAFKCMLDLARADAGTTLFEGMPLTPALFDRMTYVHERPALYGDPRVIDHLEWTRRTYARYDAQRAAKLLDLFGLAPKKRVKNLSKGQQSALALTLAFVTRPDILILDEPASGLDPVNQRNVLDLLIGEAAGGATIVFSSHAIGQVERAADRVAILHRGKKMLDGEVDLLKADEKVVEATFENDAPSVNGLAANPSVRRIVRAGRLLRAFVRGNSDDVTRHIAALEPKSLRVLDQNLEDIFLNAVAASDGSAAAAAADLEG